MAVVVVGGQTRGVGKTSVVCSLIAAMPERQWTAIKLSAHGHSASVDVREEMNAECGTDSARYLAAGAVRSFYISVPEGGLANAMPKLEEILGAASDAFVESTSVLEFLQPELALAVMDPVVGEVKESLRRWWQRLGAVITTGSGPLDGSPKWLGSKPGFVVTPPEYCSDELVTFVREGLKKK